MSNRWPAHAKTRRNAYEIPTWAIAHAIRRRPDKPKAVARHDPEPPQRPDGGVEIVRPDAIVFKGAEL
jgi:hypothetical protein